MKPRKWQKPFAAFSLLAALTGCGSTTSQGQVGVERQQLLLVGSEQVDQMAARAYQDVLKDAAKNKVLNKDAVVVKRVRGITNRLVKGVGVFRADALKWRWQINVIDSEQLNAWCMQGGRMAIYSGLIEQLKLSDDEIAAVLGHEMAHALREHSRERISQSLATQVGLNVGAAFLGLGALATDMVGMGAQLMLTLPNSRVAEREADRIGVELAARAGYDPRAAVSLWAKMSRKSGGKRPPEWLSTHPSPEQRTQDLKRYAERVLPLYEQRKRQS